MSTRVPKYFAAIDDAGYICTVKRSLAHAQYVWKRFDLAPVDEDYPDIEAKDHSCLSSADEMILRLRTGDYLVLNMRTAKHLGTFRLLPADFVGDDGCKTFHWIGSGRFAITYKPGGVRYSQVPFIFNTSGVCEALLPEKPLVMRWNTRTRTIRVIGESRDFYLLSSSGAIVQKVSAGLGEFCLDSRSNGRVPFQKLDPFNPTQIHPSLVRFSCTAFGAALLDHPDEQRQVYHIYLWRTEPERYLRATASWLKQNHLPQGLIQMMLRQI